MQVKVTDSTMSFYVNQLEKLDTKLHLPLESQKWNRDITLREGVAMTDEVVSFLRQNYGAIGTQSATGKPWISSNTTAIPTVSIDGTKESSPIRLLSHEISYTGIALEKSRMSGMDLERDSYNALTKLYNQGIDEQVYIGDTHFSVKGLTNSATVTAGSVSGGVWSGKTADAIVADVNAALEASWAATGYNICPNKLILPPAQFALIAGKLVSTAGNISVLQYIKNNSITLAVNGTPLDIVSSKWLTGRGVSSADRMVVYTNSNEYLRFPLVPIRRETTETRGLFAVATYLWAMGQVEFIYPETVRYVDGI